MNFFERGGLRHAQEQARRPTEDELLDMPPPVAYWLIVLEERDLGPVEERRRSVLERAVGSVKLDEFLWR
jgi:hypothetical protein